MTMAILTGAAILLSAGYILRRQRLDTLDVRAGQIRPSERLVLFSGAAQSELVVEKAGRKSHTLFRFQLTYDRNAGVRDDPSAPDAPFGQLGLSRVSATDYNRYGLIQTTPLDRQAQ